MTLVAGKSKLPVLLSCHLSSPENPQVALSHELVEVQGGQEHTSLESLKESILWKLNSSEWLSPLRTEFEEMVATAVNLVAVSFQVKPVRPENVAEAP